MPEEEDVQKPLKHRIFKKSLKILNDGTAYFEVHFKDCLRMTYAIKVPPPITDAAIEEAVEAKRLDAVKRQKEWDDGDTVLKEKLIKAFKNKDYEIL